jgi:hypothetical protein
MNNVVAFSLFAYVALKIVPFVIIIASSLLFHACFGFAWIYLAKVKKFMVRWLNIRWWVVWIH